MYKAVIMDLDGTAIPNKREGIPSQRVIDAISKIKDKVFICAASGRGMGLASHIIKALGLTAPCIVGGGTQIIDPVTEEILWEKDMDESQVAEVLKIVKKYNYPVYLSSDDANKKDKSISKKERIIYVHMAKPEDAKEIVAQLKNISGIAAHSVMSWAEGQLDVHVTHGEATKKHALEVLLNILKVHKDEVVAIGDSNNDLPLFELAGYKVAMGNGSEDLKKAADFIGPTVEEEGVAVVLEKLFS